MARKADTTDIETDAGRKQMVSAAVPTELHEAVESHRWANRMSKAAVVEEALREWATARGLL